MIPCVIIGIASGIISGMGIGGGTLLIPALCFFFHMDQKSAQSINLIYFLPTACIALLSHAKDGNIEKKNIPILVFFGLAAAASGSFLALKIDSGILRKAFGFFLLFLGASEFFRKNENSKQ